VPDCRCVVRAGHGWHVVNGLLVNEEAAALREGQALRKYLHQVDGRLPQVGRPLSWRTLVAVLALLGGALGFVALIQAERPTPGQMAAQAIERGMNPTPDPEALQDEALTGNAREAGYRWAERWDLDNADRCPDYSPDFKAGCVAFVSDETGH
jgi:hypothetical protein